LTHINRNSWSCSDLDQAAEGFLCGLSIYDFLELDIYHNSSFALTKMS